MCLTKLPFQRILTNFNQLFIQFGLSKPACMVGGFNSMI
jgi:hypothetical protein